MQPYPNYQNFYPYQQPMDNLAQLRAQQYPTMMQMGAQMPLQYQQPVQQSIGISGKFVQGVDGITANDVPMDGSTAIFPKQDMSEIYAKSWNADGTIKTIVYRPVNDQANNQAQEVRAVPFELSEKDTRVFMERFDDVIERISKLEKSIKAPTRKKEAGLDE